MSKHTSPGMGGHADPRISDRISRAGTEAHPTDGMDAMTSAQTILARVMTALLTAAAAIAGPAGCVSGDQRDRFSAPTAIVAPYETSERDVVWAVLPPRNESGTSLVRADLIGDELVAAVQQIRGVRCLPLNRSLEVARSLGLEDGPRDSADATRLAEALGVDGVIAASITAYDPYDPPIIGLALALYARPGAMAEAGSRSAPDAFSLSMAFSDFGRFDGVRFGGEPVTTVSEHLDARDHAVLMTVKSYAEGRSDPKSAMRWRIYMASMELYTRFAAYHTVGRLIDEEWLRLARDARPTRTP
ncbi:MAG: hypothetical protein AAGA55_03080 [Planctomycetota bacterium]